MRAMVTGRCGHPNHATGHLHPLNSLDSPSTSGHHAGMRFPDDVPTLTSGDVTLRAASPADVAGVVEQCNDPASIRWTTVPQPYGTDEARHFVTEVIPAGWTAGTSLTFVIESTHADGERRFGGSLGVRLLGDGLAEIAYGLHPDARGRRVATTAVSLLLHWAFEEQQLETVTWYANVGNWASRRVAWRCGFTILEGALPRRLPQRGEYIDAWAGALHRDDPREPRHPWLTPSVIDSGTVRLRPLRDGDVPVIAEAGADERVQAWLPTLPSPYTLADGAGFVEHVRLGQSLGQQVQWAVADPATDTLTAVVGLPRISAQHQSAEIGYWAHPAARGRGVVTEAVRLVTRHCFVPAEDGGLGLQRLEIVAAEGNAASQHVARAAGFVEVGRRRCYEPARDGSRRDVVVFDALASQWRSG